VERVEVSQYRLATHLLLACLIFVAALWTALELEARPGPDVPVHSRTTAAALLVLTLLQIYMGALLAGLRGGLMYNTWPLIDGTLFPPITELFSVDPAWRNVFENVLTVQFAHRMTAYALAAGVTVQACLGILTLVLQVPPPLALLHQAMAIVVLCLAVVNAQRLWGKRPRAIVSTVQSLASTRGA
jgi:heme a synthase